MAFNGNEGSPIDAATAQRWIANYQKNIGPDDVRAEFIGFRKISDLLGQENAVGLRIYYGKDDNGKNTLVIVACNADQKNIAPIDGGVATADGSEGLMMDNMSKCPPYCP